MNKKPFSVAISVYSKDNAAYFDRALESITEQQSVKPDEIVLVCDGPLNEDLDRVIEKYKNKEIDIKIIRLSHNKGLGNALKIAVENASYELIARMDSDDVSYPKRFEQQLDMFSKDLSLDIVGGDITEFIDEESNIVSKRNVPCVDYEIKKYMKKRAALNHVSVMFRKKAVLQAGGYLDLYWNEDYYLWIRMVENGSKMANTGTSLVNVRIGKDMYKRRGGVRYFKSELFIQNLMLKKGMIGLGQYAYNVLVRFVVQVLIPPNVRGIVFRIFAR